MCDYNPFTHRQYKKGFILEEKLHIAPFIAINVQLSGWITFHFNSPL